MSRDRPTKDRLEDGVTGIETAAKDVCRQSHPRHAEARETRGKALVLFESGHEEKEEEDDEDVTLASHGGDLWAESANSSLSLSPSVDPR